MEHSKQSEKFGFKFPLPFCLDILAIQLDFFTLYVALGIYSFVIGSLLEVLSVQKVLVTNFHQLPQFYSQSFG